MNLAAKGRMVVGSERVRSKGGRWGEGGLAQTRVICLSMVAVWGDKGKVWGQSSTPETSQQVILEG